MEKRQVTNDELYEYLYSIEPIDEVQRKLINKVMGVVYMGMTDNTPKPVREFIDNYDEFEGKDANRVYTHYVEFCEANGYTAISNIAFGKALCKACNLKSKLKNVKGKRVRVYTFKEVN